MHQITTKKLLVLGVFPPPIGGTTVSLQLLVNALEDEKYIDLSTYDLKGLRSVGIVGKFKKVLEIVAEIRKADVVFFNLGVGALLRFGMLFYIFCMFLRKRILLRRFGGISRVDLGWLSSFMLGRFYAFSDCVYCQTKRQLLDVVPSKQRWFPTAREKLTADCRLKRLNREFNFRLVFISQVKFDKGIGVLRDAVATLRREYPKLEVTVYGPDYTDGIIYNLEREGFVYGGEVEHEKVFEILEGCDAVVLPTFYSGEGYPGILVEALHAYCPIVTTKWKDVPELLGSAAIYAEPNETTSLVEAINTLYKNKYFTEDMLMVYQEKIDLLSIDSQARAVCSDVLYEN